MKPILRNIIIVPAVIMIFQCLCFAGMVTDKMGVGIGTGTPVSDLQVVGRVTTSSFTMTTGAVNGYVLTSGASGIGTWQSVGTNLLNSTNTWTAPNTYTSTMTLSEEVLINSNLYQTAAPSLRMNTFDGNAIIFFPSLGAGYYNPLVQAADSGMIFVGSNSALDIVPWAASASGIRITTITVTIADNVNNSGYRIQTSSFTFTGVTQNAGTGFIGEIVEGKTSTPINAAASGSFTAIASCALTPGEWDISGIGELYGNNATLVAGDVEVCISATSASSSGCTEGYDVAYWYTGAGSIGTGHRSFAIPRRRVLITGNTTYYLNGVSLYSAGTPQWTGSISARRIR